jgi:hypothetical protein
MTNQSPEDGSGVNFRNVVYISIPNILQTTDNVQRDIPITKMLV